MLFFFFFSLFEVEIFLGSGTDVLASLPVFHVMSPLQNLNKVFSQIRIPLRTFSRGFLQVNSMSERQKKKKKRTFFATITIAMSYKLTFHVCLLKLQ